MGRRRQNAMRKEYDHYMITNKENQIYHQKHNYRHHGENIININPQKQRRVIELIPKSTNQEQYILALTDQETDVVVVSGPAGTGKTYLAMLAAIRALRNRECSRIILTRPAITVDDEKHGFLPGDINQKMEPWTKPLFDVLREHYSSKEIEAMVAEQIIEIAPLAFMRGRTFKDSFIIVDESQNCTPAQMKMILTRIGENSKIVVTGDTNQTDRITRDNGLLDLQSRLLKNPVPGLAVCTFDMRDVRRHPIIEYVLKTYE